MQVSVSFCKHASMESDIHTYPGRDNRRRFQNESRLTSLGGQARRDSAQLVAAKEELAKLRRTSQGDKGERACVPAPVKAAAARPKPQEDAVESPADDGGDPTSNDRPRFAIPWKFESD